MMFLLAKLLLSGVFIVSLYSCTSRFASPIYGNEVTYLPKPMVRDSLPWATYLSADMTTSSGYNWPNDKNFFGEVNINQVYTFKHGHAALGSFVYGGHYTFGFDSSYAELSPYMRKYGYKGAGIRGGIDFTIPFRRSEIRFPGIEVVWAKEWGAYHRFREIIDPVPSVVADTQDRLLSLAVAVEYHIRFSSDISLAIKWWYNHYFIGNLPTNENHPFIDTASVCYVLAYKKFTWYLQANVSSNVGVKTGIAYQMW